MVEVDILLDSSVLIDILREVPNAISWAKTNQSLRIGIPVIVWMEIIFGARDKTDQAHLSRELSAYSLIYLDEETQEEARQLLLLYHLRQNISPFDCLVAATAVKYGKPLFTLDGDFSGIPALTAVRPY